MIGLIRETTYPFENDETGIMTEGIELPDIGKIIVSIFEKIREFVSNLVKQFKNFIKKADEQKVEWTVNYRIDRILEELYHVPANTKIKFSDLPSYRRDMNLYLNQFQSLTRTVLSLTIDDFMDSNTVTNYVNKFRDLQKKNVNILLSDLHREIVIPVGTAAAYLQEDISTKNNKRDEFHRFEELTEALSDYFDKLVDDARRYSKIKTNYTYMDKRNINEVVTSTQQFKAVLLTHTMFMKDMKTSYTRFLLQSSLMMYNFFKKESRKQKMPTNPSEYSKDVAQILADRKNGKIDDTSEMMLDMLDHKLSDNGEYKYLGKDMPTYIFPNITSLKRYTDMKKEQDMINFMNLNVQDSKKDNFNDTLDDFGVRNKDKSYIPNPYKMSFVK